MSTNTQTLAAESILLTEIDNGIAWLTLNRPAQFNSLSSELLAAMQTGFDEIAKDETIRVVIIKANGKAFCAGHDLKEMRSSEEREFHQQLFNQCGRLMHTINQLPQPVIAMVQGIATAAGCQLVAACDLAVASDNAKFAVSGINFGLFCSTPAVPLSRNLNRKRAMKMLLTGDFIDAQTAQEFGLVNDVSSEAALLDSTQQIAQSILNKSALSIRVGKEMFYKQLEMTLTDAYSFASDTMACNMDSIDAREGLDAFIEKRKPSWVGK